MTSRAAVAEANPLGGARPTYAESRAASIQRKHLLPTLVLGAMGVMVAVLPVPTMWAVVGASACVLAATGIGIAGLLRMAPLMHLE